MSALDQTHQPRKRPILRVILLLFAILSLPLGCCGCATLLDVLPASLLPGRLDFIVNLFEGEALVENRTGETLYLTPITTTYGYPQVLPQTTAIRQRDIPVKPNHSISLTYDIADMPLAGIVVCRSKDDCRLLDADGSNTYSLDSFEKLPHLDPSWLQAVQSHSRYNFMILLMPIFSPLPVVLFAGWLYVLRVEKKKAG